MATDQIVIRAATLDDLDEVIEVCGQALGWSDAGNDEAFFRWKHLDNPFGPSLIWVAEDLEGGDAPAQGGSAIVGVRTMMRWMLRRPGGPRVAMVRAVDTATLPSYQGRGIFSRLTVGAVEALTADGVAAVFNTPNDKSRPGYLKMGWHELGRLPTLVRPRTVGALAAMLRSRVAADKWGVATDVGLDPADALADRDAVEAAIAADRPPSGWSTSVDAEYLRWRTGFGPLAVRVQLVGSSVAEGFVVFRVRRRGELRQLSLLHLIGPVDRAGRRRVIGDLLDRTGSDVALATGAALGVREWLVALPRTGPIFTWRPLADPHVPSLGALDLELGAVELF